MKKLNIMIITFLLLISVADYIKAQNFMHSFSGNAGMKLSNQQVSFLLENNGGDFYFKELILAGEKQVSNNLNYKSDGIGFNSVGPMLTNLKTGFDDKSLVDFNSKVRKRTYISSLLFIPSIATGYILSNSEKPNDLVLAVHKLSSASNLVLVDLTLWQKHKKFGLSNSEKIAGFTMNFLFLSTICTGTLLALDDSPSEFINQVHSISPWLTVLSTAVVLYLLNN